MAVARSAVIGDVGKFGTLVASNFKQRQQLSTFGKQQLHYKSVTNQPFSTCSNNGSTLIRDQGVGGSNPLSPTNFGESWTTLKKIRPMSMHASSANPTSVVGKLF